jgi:succinyl-diaminopimelate desuccinylase
MSRLKIDSTIRKQTKELLAQLVAIRSMNPPGEEDGAVAFVEALLKSAGIATTRVPLEPGRSSLVARVPGRDDGSVVFCAHLDTVGTDETQWTSPPLEPHRDGDRLYGIGSADMKSGVAVILTLALQLATQRVPLSKSVVLALTADEEKAYRGAASVAASGLIDDAEFLVIPEPTAGKAYCGQKGELWLEATFSGKAAHGSMPHLGINTILPAASFCLSLARAAETFPETPGRGRTSLNVGQIDGGWQVNIVPDRTRVRLDSRVTSLEERRRILELVESTGKDAAAVVGATFDLDVFNDVAPIVSDADHPMVQALLSAVFNDGAATQRIEIAPYSTDAVAIVPKLGIPVVIYGPGSIAQAHQPNEYVELSTVDAVLDGLARFANRALVEKSS